MDNLHIAFLSLPHSPHVYPTLPIVSSLARRGYRVTYATSERFSSAAENAGAEVVLCPKLLFESSAAPERNSGETELPEDPLSSYTKRALETVTPFYFSQRPDLILYDFMAFSGRILASQMAVRAIQTSPFYALDEESFEDQVRHDGFRKVLLDHARVVAHFLRQQGVSCKNYRTDKEELNIYLFPRVLQPNSELFGEECFFAGRCAAERLPASSWRSSADGRPIVLVAMSTLFATFTTGAKIPVHFRICVDALLDLGWHIVLCIGEGCDPTALMPLPPHCEIIPHTSYANVLSHASLLIYMSGIISTAEAAYCGIPMIAITEGVSEYEWQADHVEALGIGTHIRKSDLNTENLRRAVRHLCEDQQVHRRLHEVLHEVRREPGAEDTANRIEDYLASQTHHMGT